MADNSCKTIQPEAKDNAQFRRMLWISLIINALMFFVEFIGGLTTKSVALWADSLDFAGDTANYGLAIAVFSLGLYWRATAALIKGISMFAFGVFVMSKAAWSLWQGQPPEPILMGSIAILAFIANFTVSILLFGFREGDANMRSVWLCSRNDAIGNVAVILAAVGVFGTQSIFPDLFVACIMAYLGISSGLLVMKQAHRERQAAKA